MIECPWSLLDLLRREGSQECRSERHSGVVILAVVLVASPLLLLAVLTAIGERRRGAPLPIVVVAGIFFPVTWVTWYVRDERPYWLTG